MGEVDLTKLAKGNIKTGMTAMVGHNIFGTMGGLPGMPAQAATASNIAGAGLNLSVVGSVAKTGLGLANMFSTEMKGKNPVPVPTSPTPGPWPRKYEVRKW